MGNVQAAEAPMPQLVPPPPTSEPTKPQQTSGSGAGDEGDRNPGLYEDLHKQSKGNFLW